MWSAKTRLALSVPGSNNEKHVAVLWRPCSGSTLLAGPLVSGFGGCISFGIL